jgi:hypothetical protein
MLLTQEKKEKKSMALWIKPNGTKIEVNDNQATIDYVVSLNWKPAKEAVTNDNSTTDSKRSSRTRKRKNG